MIDLHMHTVYSDGELIPAELARRAKVAGYRAVAFTDHADHSNVEHILAGMLKMVHDYSLYAEIDILAGVELTHVPPALIPDMTARARQLGAQIVIVHGETIVEPVAPGTNHAAIMAGVDILAHPGLITPQDVELAAEKNVCLEITTRKGHSLTNGHVTSLARKHQARLVINNDAHSPGDLVDRDMRRNIALGAGMSEDEYLRAEQNSVDILARIRSRAK
ncbi:histidinol phosphate phosphatase domain-containing protein [Desulfonatronovibrio hydrogenovorans]|uniref:histidinol phosphate phosphatase domain-containing protein n=1 Tax=Desulfonatronovibrio hydrogenovorans TaxID=53245 RepID=UPI00048CB4C4|nr:histidinol phosphate phosphatase domain-containing protein [Desulfonatronovibrio hydrogenovorans]